MRTEYCTTNSVYIIYDDITANRVILDNILRVVSRYRTNGLHHWSQYIILSVIRTGNITNICKLKLSKMFAYKLDIIFIIILFFIWIIFLLSFKFWYRHFFQLLCITMTIHKKTVNLNMYITSRWETFLVFYIKINFQYKL